MVIVHCDSKEEGWLLTVLCGLPKLNSIICQVPRIDATVDSLAGATYFITLDLASHYWQVEVEEPDKEKQLFNSQ